MDEQQQEIYNILMELLHSIRQGDVETYKKLTSDELTCFEPETDGHNVEGLDFHFFLMNNSESIPYHIELVNPKIRVYEETAYAAYNLLLSQKGEEKIEISDVQETRIFNRKEDGWKMVHFHRSQ